MPPCADGTRSRRKGGLARGVAAGFKTLADDAMMVAKEMIA
jgi:hypothetical protein